jgi:hypothetical protein
LEGRGLPAPSLLARQALFLRLRGSAAWFQGGRSRRPTAGRPPRPTALRRPASHPAGAKPSAPPPPSQQTVREVRFRHTYGAAVLSVHRSGETLTGDTAAIKLQPGDVLVLEAGPEFSHVFQHSPAFALINEVRAGRRRSPWPRCRLAAGASDAPRCRRRVGFPGPGPFPERDNVIASFLGALSPAP